VVEKQNTIDGQPPETAEQPRQLGRADKLLADMIDGIRAKTVSEAEFLQAIDQIYDEDRRYAATLSAHLVLDFAPRVDGEGAFYANMKTADGMVLVNVFPPRDLWNGQVAPVEPELHETDWQLIVDGEKVGQGPHTVDLKLKQGYNFELSQQPDGYGFYYGQLTNEAGEHFIINVLPPAHLWSGDQMLPGYEPDDKTWILYADSEEVGRVETLEPVKIAQLLAKPE